MLEKSWLAWKATVIWIHPTQWSRATPCLTLGSIWKSHFLNPVTSGVPLCLGTSSPFLESYCHSTVTDQTSLLSWCSLYVLPWNLPQVFSRSLVPQAELWGFPWGITTYPFTLSLSSSNEHRTWHVRGASWTKRWTDVAGVQKEFSNSYWPTCLLPKLLFNQSF